MSSFLTVRGEVDPAFADLMRRAADAHPSQRLTADMIRAYAAALSRDGLTLDRVAALLNAATVEYGRFPSIGDLFRLLAPTGDDAALLAWTALGRAAEAVGAYATVTVEDGCAAEALERVFGSWSEFCETDDGPGLALRRQEFLAAFRDARRRGARGPKMMVGLCGPAPSGMVGRIWSARITVAGAIEMAPSGLLPVWEANRLIDGEATRE